MSVKLQAARDLQKLGSMMRGIMELAPDLEKMGEVEAEVERMTALSIKLKEEIEGVKVTLSNARKEHTELIEAGKKITRDAHAQEKVILANAEEKGRTIVRAAKEAGALEIEQASATVRSFDERIKERQDALSKVSKAFAEEEGKLNSLRNRVSEFKESLTNIN